jgi:hypothetical protein
MDKKAARIDISASSLCILFNEGKNWYVNTDDRVITVNVCSFTIITAHKVKNTIVYHRLKSLKKTQNGLRIGF